MAKRDDSFAQYHESTQDRRLEHLRRALSILKHGKYPNVTKLAQAAAKLVTELELKDAKDGEEPRPVAFTTLMRNKQYYRPALEAYFHSDNDRLAPDIEASVPAAEYETLKIHCANLDHQNRMLKDRLAYATFSGEMESLPGNNSKNITGDDRIEDISFLIKFVDAIMSQVPEMFDQYDRKQTSLEHPEPGLYGPESLALTWDELERFKRLRDECKAKKL